MQAHDGRGCQDRPQGWERSLQRVAIIFVVKGVEVTATDAGNVRYASEGADHHGDLVFRSRHIVPMEPRQTATFMPTRRNQMLESQH